MRSPPPRTCFATHIMSLKQWRFKTVIHNPEFQRFQMVYLVTIVIENCALVYLQVKHNILEMCTFGSCEMGTELKRVERKWEGHK